MDYKYKKGQIFGKRLKVPKYILKKVYNCTLTIKELLEYELDDKIPTSCIDISERDIVEKLGVEKIKKLDWELINIVIYHYSVTSLKDLLLSIDPKLEDVNLSLYELVKDKIKLEDYTPGMKEVYSNRFFDITSEENENTRYMMRKFNRGDFSLRDMIYTWNLCKDKDLSYCLMNDDKNNIGITESELKEFMSEYQTLAIVIVRHSQTNIYSFIKEIKNLESEEAKKEYIKKITDAILAETHREYGDYRNPLELENEEYQEIFKYSSLEEHLEKFNRFQYATVVEELKNLPPDYVFNIPIPFKDLCNYGVLNFIGTYGLKNVVDFDNECGHFFTNNNCEMLKLMNDMYLHYGGNTHDESKTIFTRNCYDENGKWVERPYTKDEFYEAMRRMIIYGPSDWNYISKAPDYRTMIGEFRVRNSELFIAEEAPKELQTLFYTKSITPEILREHPEFIPYLEGKDLESCLQNREVTVEGSSKLYGFENIYKFIGTKTDFNGTMKLITEYSEVFNIIFDRRLVDSYRYEMKFSKDDDVSQIQKTINETLRKVIIEKGIAYPKYIPENLRENYPSMFLSSEAPKELQEAFYSRNITTEFILSNPDYRNYLQDVDLEILFKYMPVSIVKNRYDQINLVSAMRQIFDKNECLDIMLSYGKYVEAIFEKNQLQSFSFNPRGSKDEFLEEMDTVALEAIIKYNLKYDENMPEHFKKENPTLFLDKAVSQDIKDKFYNRELTLSDFANNPDLLEEFGNTNVICGFSEKHSWMIPLFEDYDNLKLANANRLKVISAYLKIQDVELQKAFREYITETGKEFDVEKIEYAAEVLSRLSLSNSSEIFTFRKELATQILQTADPIESLNKIEDIFIRNNIPTVGKIYSCFEILHPDFKGFNFETSRVSPVLKNTSTRGKKFIVFADLIKASFGSNNRAVNAYLENIEKGSNLYESIKNGTRKYNNLNDAEKKELLTFSKHLVTLYNNTAKGKKENNNFVSTGDVLKDILELSKKLSPDGSLNYSLADRVVRMFCGFAGIDTLEEAKAYINQKIKIADTRNRKTAQQEMTLEKGDFIKGIGGIVYLRNILQNGSVSKEYLGSSASSDATPLDTDVSMIMSSEGTIEEKFASTAAKSYGPIWFVLKNDDRFVTTRTKEEVIETKRDMDKLEVFYTGNLGEGHYGIRTGFASSEINYIVVEKYDSRVCLEIAMNGFYIPIADKTGKIIFTPNDYENLRAKMSGLSYFGEQSFSFSNNLVTEETLVLAELIEQSNLEVKLKREKINAVIKSSLEELGLELKTTIDGDLTEGTVELIDTGSTGRGTNKPGDGDFDFMMRLDKTILSNPEELAKLKNILLKNLGKEHSLEVTGNGDFRLKSVQIDAETNVDIDITFTEKTDKIAYSTDMALQDRLETIQKDNPEKYKYVVANILLAKQVLKQAEVYKPNRGEIPQGGLGGVGIENWVLQNGGSFVDAAKSFVEAAKGKSFEEFKASYQVWDFGDNHLAARNGKYSHDNFVSNNMSEEGYKKMVQALNEYLKKHEYNESDTRKR